MAELLSTEVPLYSTFGDDSDMGELVELFVDEMAGRIDSLLKKSEANDWEGLRRLAHQIKGAAGSYGFPQVTTLAGDLELRLDSKATTESILESLDSLVALCRRIRPGVAP